MVARDYLQRFWPYFAIAGMVVILLGASAFIWETLPPRTIVMATGAEGGACHELGIRYREILAQADVELQLLTTTGALENLKRLRDPQSGVSVGFIQGGTTTQKESPGVESLGTVFLRAAVALHPNQWQSCRRVEWPTIIGWSRGKRDSRPSAQTT
jgi:TRAP-type uncharacterized transport system substrate-binding protein